MTECLITEPPTELETKVLRRLSIVIADHILGDADQFFANKYHNGKLEVGIREDGKEYWVTLSVTAVEAFGSPERQAALAVGSTACCGGGCHQTAEVPQKIPTAQDDT